MNIHAMTVCVNYSDWLAYAAPRWAKNLASWTIVTDSKDEATAALAKAIGAQLFRTDVFYANGAAFNKGAAMEEARQALPEWRDWFLFIDADIVPPADWYDRIVDEFPQSRYIYHSHRYQCCDLNNIDSPLWPMIPESLKGNGPGYFQLFHTADAHFRPLETCWKHAGVYDSHFAFNWPVDNRRELPLRLVHLGEQENWWGRGNRDAFRRMNKERIRCGSYQQERI